MIFVSRGENKNNVALEGRQNEGWAIGIYDAFTPKNWIASDPLWSSGHYMDLVILTLNMNLRIKQALSGGIEKLSEGHVIF